MITTNKPAAEKLVSPKISRIGPPSEIWLDVLGCCMELLDVGQLNNRELPVMLDGWRNGWEPTAVANALWGPLPGKRHRQ